jgi:hypothetical protein
MRQFLVNMDDGSKRNILLDDDYPLTEINRAIFLLRDRNERCNRESLNRQLKVMAEAKAAVDPQRNNWWNREAMAQDPTGAPKDAAQRSDVNDSWKDDRYGD